jgi:hypothetical protein
MTHSGYLNPVLKEAIPIRLVPLEAIASKKCVPSETRRLRLRVGEAVYNLDQSLVSRSGVTSTCTLSRLCAVLLHYRL